jgi:hypothetical protein
MPLLVPGPLPGDILTRMRKTLALLIFAIAAAQAGNSQSICPVSLTSATAGQDRIQLEFRNVSKLPIEEIGLSCNPPVAGKTRGAICHDESGIFYPGTESWVQIDYPAANRHNIVLSITQVRLAGRVYWHTKPTNSCKALIVSRKK